MVAPPDPRLAALEQQVAILIQWLNTMREGSQTGQELLVNGILSTRMGTAARTDTAAADGEIHAYESGGIRYVGIFSRVANAWTYQQMGVSGGGAPVGATYLVTTAHADLTAEEVVGLTPGGELGGTWAVPTVDGTHSGSAHHSAVTLNAGADPLLTLAGQELNLGDVAAQADFADHNARHEPGGADVMAVDAAAATGSLRTIGTGALQAAAGSHSTHSANHGASEHTNRTRRIPFYGQYQSTGTATAIPANDVHGTLSGGPHWDQADAAITRYKPLLHVVMPTDYVAGTVSLNILFSVAATGGNVRWETEVFEADAADTAHTTLLNVDTDVAAPAANTITLFTVNLTTNPTAGKKLFYNLARLGSHANDTSTSQSSIWAVWLEYTADM